MEHETDRNNAALIGITARQNTEIAHLRQENAKLKILLSDAQECVEKMLGAVVLKKEPKATSFYSTQDVIKSLESGNTQSAQKAVLDIYNTKVENKVAEGKTKKEADKSARSSIKSALTSEYKARYVNWTASERSKIQKMLKSIYINGKPLYENKDFSSWLKD